MKPLVKQKYFTIKFLLAILWLASGIFGAQSTHAQTPNPTFKDHNSKIDANCSSLLSQTNPKAFEDLRSLYAATLAESRRQSKNPNFAAGRLLSEAVNESMTRLAQSPKSPQLTTQLIHRLQDLVDDGYPYLRTLRALGAVVFFADRGAILPEEANDSTIIDPVVLDQELELHAAQLSELYEVDMTLLDGLRGRIFYFPTFESLNFEDINLMLAANIHPLGMSFKTNFVDGIRYLPVGMFAHDAQHSAQIVPSNSRTSHLYEKHVQDRLAAFFDQTRNQLSIQQRYLVHGIVFQVVHEDGRPYSHLLTSLKYEDNLRAEVKTTLKLDRKNRPAQLRLTDRALDTAWNWILDNFPGDL